MANTTSKKIVPKRRNSRLNSDTFGYLLMVISGFILSQIMYNLAAEVIGEDIIYICILVAGFPLGIFQMFKMCDDYKISDITSDLSGCSILLLACISPYFVIILLALVIPFVLLTISGLLSGWALIVIDLIKIIFGFPIFSKREKKKHSGSTAQPAN